MSIVRATENVWVSPTRLVKAGELFNADDPIVKARGGLFVDATPQVDQAPIEEATAAPGEKRQRRARKPAAKKPADDDTSTDDVDATPQVDQD
jgi:hypothetical protein